MQFWHPQSAAQQSWELSTQPHVTVTESSIQHWPSQHPFLRYKYYKNLLHIGGWWGFKCTPCSKQNMSLGCCWIITIVITNKVWLGSGFGHKKYPIISGDNIYNARYNYNNHDSTVKVAERGRAEAAALCWPRLRWTRNGKCANARVNILT